MDYRTISINWQPRSAQEWTTFNAARREAGRLWSDLVERHYRIRKAHWKWPSKGRWFRWAKGRYLGLHSQSVQQIATDFCDAIYSTYHSRKIGNSVEYPWRRPEYHDVIYTNQAARIRDGVLILPNGKSGDLRIRLPKGITLPGRLMEVRLRFGEVQIICEVPGEAKPTGPTIGVDLGVNTILAATDGEKAILVSGREAKATVQWRAKRLASIQQKQSQCSRGSRRWKRLQRRKMALLRKAANRTKDITHKATRKVANAFPNAKCYVGKTFNDAARKMGRKQAQQVSSACNAKLIAQLDYKTNGAIQVGEAYSSQTCPVCGTRNKCKRIYRCQKCGIMAPRDAIGATNILCIGQNEAIVPGRNAPSVLKWVYPIKYSGRSPDSSGRDPASSSRKREAAIGDSLAIDP